jgi:hypothetical protein
MTKIKDLICFLLIMLSFPVAIGLLARWHDVAPFLGIIALIALFAVYVIAKLLLWLDKKVGPTDF